MKQTLLMTIGCIMICGAVLADADTDRIAEARGVVKQFFGSLKGELETAMKTGGPVAAVSVCYTRAPIITNASSASSGWGVARTSLRLRNPQNKPDAWEKKVLEEFEMRKAAGEDITKMEYTKTVTENGKKVFRYMKAIPTAELCLNCHGSNLKPDVVENLDQLYPEDQARGYAAGDIRGAFTLKKTL